jgi:hypothetical protein
MMEKTLASIERVKKKEAKQRKQDDEVFDCWWKKDYIDECQQ